jgi:hypothetical protein
MLDTSSAILGDELERAEANLGLPTIAPPPPATAPAQRFARQVVSAAPPQVAVGPICQPGKAHLDCASAAHDGASQRMRAGRYESHGKIARPRGGGTGENRGPACPVGSPEQFVTADASEQRASSGQLEKRSVEMGVERP